MPAALVGVLAARGVPHEELLASVVALAILVTLLVQALSSVVAGRAPAARRYGVSAHF